MTKSGKLRRQRILTRKRTRPRNTARSLEQAFRAELAEAARLVDRQQWGEARKLFERLDRRYPRRREVLAGLLHVCQQVNDLSACQNACERLLSLNPDAGDLWLMLAGYYQANGRAAEALKTFRSYLDRWPTEVHAEAVCNTVANLESLLAGDFGGPHAAAAAPAAPRLQMAD